MLTAPFDRWNGIKYQKYLSSKYQKYFFASPNDVVYDATVKHPADKSASAKQLAPGAPWVTLGVLLLVGAGGWLFNAASQRQAAKDKAAEVKAQQEAVAARVMAEESAKLAAIKRCQSEAGLIMAEARQALAKGDPGRSGQLLAPCREGWTNSEGVALLKQTDAAIAARAQKMERERSANMAKVAAAAKAQKRKEGVSIGMTPQDVLDSSWGRPKRVNRTTTSSGTDEQWVYDGGGYLYFRGGVLRAIQN